MTTKEVLIAAKALIDTEDKWLKGHASNCEMTAFCSIGALSFVARPHSDYARARDALEAAMPALALAMFRCLRFVTGEPVVSGFNDWPWTTHADVMAWFDRAIEAAS